MSNITNATYAVNQTSLWGTPLTLLEGSNFQNKQSLAYLIVTFITFFGILYAFLSSHDVNYMGSAALGKRHAYSLLETSMSFYQLAYLFQIIDIFLAERAVRLKAGYVFVSVFRDGFFHFADIAILAVVTRITYYQCVTWNANLKFHAAWRLWCKICLTVLAALSLYRWGVRTAYIVLLLNGVNALWVERLMDEASELKLGYQALYVVVVALIIVYAATLLWKRTGFREWLNVVETRFVLITLLLFIRSISEADFTLKYIYRSAPQASYVRTANAVLYGFPTVAIFIILNFLSFPDPPSVVKTDILRDARRTARKELKRQRVDASKGGPALPTPAQLLTEIEKKPLWFMSDRARRGLGSLSEVEARDTIARHIEDVLTLREKI